jgi:hypothetical protein
MKRTVTIILAIFIVFFIAIMSITSVNSYNVKTILSAKEFTVVDISYHGNIAGTVHANFNHYYFQNTSSDSITVINKRYDYSRGKKISQAHFQRIQSELMDLSSRHDIFQEPSNGSCLSHVYQCELKSGFRKALIKYGGSQTGVLREIESWF